MQETIVIISFWLYALLIVGGSLLAVLARSLVRSLCGLILALFGVAGLYLLMAAPLLALMQLLIYVGAVVVLIFFAIMLTRAPAGGEELEKRSLGHIAKSLVGSLIPAGILGYACFHHAGSVVPTPLELAPQELGRVFLGPYVLAFELISVVLFVAMAGAVLLGFERRRQAK
ncbi:NADH-quinone oxidoreductase subunit J family protein [Desulfovibrio inopinatus]|uniref:NADH-quinone oxidoreductase subunit J family protein n=1 Tax=Desulfovibrio inopinatus TaxID=102109 RepID=UPI000422D682|nr:NADH-quinone oxidoreductase subunit J [Desulfovibrio inopinatus]